MLEQLQLDSAVKIAEMVKRPIRYRKIANKLLDTHPDLTPVRIRVIGGYSGNQFADWLRIFAV